LAKGFFGDLVLSRNQFRHEEANERGWYIFLSDEESKSVERRVVGWRRREKTRTCSWKRHEPQWGDM
jgi:hypothetical protein